MASARPGQISVRLRYSNDGGTTWLPTTAIDLWASEFSLVVSPELAIEQKFEQARRVRRVFKGRIYLTVKFAEDQFGANHDSGDAKLVSVQTWQRGTLLRVWTHDGKTSPAGVNVDGYSYFATETNTNYIVSDEDSEPEIRTDFLKSHTLKLMSRDVV